MSSQPHHQHLADTVFERRIELGLTRAAIAQAGGPSEPTLIRIEHAAEVPLRRPTFSKLDQVLQWRTGSAHAVYLGGDPVVLEDPQTPLVAGEARLSLSALATLVTVCADLTRELASQSPDVDLLRQTAALYHRALSPVVGDAVSAIMSSDSATQIDRAKIAAALRAFLDTSPDDVTPARTVANTARRSMAREHGND